MPEHTLLLTTGFLYFMLTLQDCTSNNPCGYATRRDAGRSQLYAFISIRSRLRKPFNKALKRAFDVVVSSCALVATMPIIIPIVYVIHRLASPGNLFYLQKRSGLYNKSFVLVKFRTMHCGHGDVTKQASTDDPRVFPAGRLLRRLSLDELPQLWNVLRGEMSLIGPRPHLPEHNRIFEQFHSCYHLRASILPGITGLAQVRGFRGETCDADDIECRVRSDLAYIASWSFGLDLTILVRTAGQVLRPPASAK